MSLTTLIDQVDSFISNRAKIAEIKPLLIQLREQAEACERDVRELKEKVASLTQQLDEAKKRIAAPQSPPAPFVRPSQYS